MPTPFEQFVVTQALAADEAAAQTRDIYDTLLGQSQYLDGGNFTQIHPGVLTALFELYDQRFFNGGIRTVLSESPLRFRLSQRMTQAGGKTTRLVFRDSKRRVIRTEYELTVSVALLFETFQGEERPILVSGLQCGDRLEAMQRIFEHELIHLLETLLWEMSSCAAPRFQSIALRFFGHTDYRHHLITPREKALHKFGIRQGDQVAFEMDGQGYEGVVNRITRRATVLVESSQGEPYSNGKRYEKFYIPLEELRRIGEAVR